MEPEKQIARPRVARLGRTESLRAPLLRYLFGPRPTLVVDPHSLLVEIDRLGGVVVPADIIRVTGLRRAAAETLLCKLAARHGGDVFVHGTAVLYAFPRLVRALPRLISRSPRPVWEQPRLPDPITGNRPTIDRWLVLLNVLILIVAATAAVRTLFASAWQPALATLFFALGVAALAMPFTRLARRRAHLAEIASENGRRALVRAILQRRVGSPIGAHALSHAWAEAAGRAVRHRHLLAEVSALGGVPDVDHQARIHFHFPDLDHESRALLTLRAATSTSA